MFGCVSYIEGGGREAPLRRIRGVCFRVVRVRRGTGPAAALSAVLAARRLARAGVRQALFPPDYPFCRAFARRGVAAVPLAPLYQATAAEIARCCMAQRGIEARRATVFLTADGLSPALEQTVERLSAGVRRLALSVPAGGEELARSLLLRRGAALRLLAPGEFCSADLAIGFSGSGPDSALLLNENLRVEYEGEPSAALLAALWSAGALDASALRVRAVGASR